MFVRKRSRLTLNKPFVVRILFENGLGVRRKRGPGIDHVSSSRERNELRTTKIGIQRDNDGSVILVRV